MSPFGNGPERRGESMTVSNNTWEQYTSACVICLAGEPPSVFCNAQSGFERRQHPERMKRGEAAVERQLRLFSILEISAFQVWGLYPAQMGGTAHC